MNALLLKSTSTNPYICFEPSSGIYEISGQSFSENPLTVFNHVFKWLDENLENIDHKIVMNIQADYFNSASNRFLLKMLRILDIQYLVDKNIEIVWRFSDEEVENDGIIFSQLVSIPFIFVDTTPES